jgi:hypothetical protein
MNYKDNRQSDAHIIHIEENHAPDIVADAAPREKPKRKPRGAPFPRGQSGNPKGRPPGALNKATLLAQQLLADDTESIVRSVVAAAKEGNTTAARLCLSRLIAPLRSNYIQFELREIQGRADVDAATNDGEPRLSAISQRSVVLRIASSAFQHHGIGIGKVIAGPGHPFPHRSSPPGRSRKR